LYYWTNKGLADAKLDFHSIDDDGLVPTTAADGTTSWLPAGATRPSSTVTADHLLAPLDFARAIPRYIASLEQRGWENSRIVMLAKFFGALMLHDYWTLDDVFEQRALLTYQEEQRRAWHQAIPQPSGAWNISIIDEAELSQTYDRICHADRIRANVEYNAKVRFIDYVRVSFSLTTFYHVFSFVPMPRASPHKLSLASLVGIPISMGFSFALLLASGVMVFWVYVISVMRSAICVMRYAICVLF